MSRSGSRYRPQEAPPHAALRAFYALLEEKRDTPSPSSELEARFQPKRSRVTRIRAEKLMVSCLYQLAHFRLMETRNALAEASRSPASDSLQWPRRSKLF